MTRRRASESSWWQHHKSGDGHTYPGIAPMGWGCELAGGPRLGRGPPTAPPRSRRRRVPPGSARGRDPDPQGSRKYAESDRWVERDALAVDLYCQRDCGVDLKVGSVQFQPGALAIYGAGVAVTASEHAYSQHAAIETRPPADGVS